MKIHPQLTLGILFWPLSVFAFDALGLRVHFSPIEGTDGTDTPMDDSPPLIWAAFHDALIMQICLLEMLFLLSDVSHCI